MSNLAVGTASNAPTQEGTTVVPVAAAPVLTIQKTGPAVLSYPSAVLATEASGATVITVVDPSQVMMGQYLRIGAATVRITDVTGNEVTVDAPVTAAAGTELYGSITYAIGYANQGNAPASGVLMTDTLPGNTTYVSSTVPGQHDNNFDTVVWDLGQVNAGASGLLFVTIFPDDRGAYVNTVTIGGNETPEVMTDTVTTVGGLRPSKIALTPAVTQTLDGTSATYLIQIENSLAVTATNVVVTDTLSPGFTYAATAGYSGADRITPLLNPVAGDPVPVWGTFDIPPQSALLITFTANITVGVGAGIYQNEVQAHGSNAASTIFWPLSTAAEDVRVLAPNVTGRKTVTPASVASGQLVTYTIVFSNTGTAPALHTIVTDTLPAGFKYSGAGAVEIDNGVFDGSIEPTAGATTPSWGIASLGAGGTMTITVGVYADAPTGVYSNSVIAAFTNTLLPQHEIVAPVSVTPGPDLVIQKLADPNPLAPGSLLTYTLVVTNVGVAPARSVVVTDVLPITVTRQSAESSQGSCTGSTTITCTLGTLEVGVRVVMTVVVSTPVDAGAGTLANTAFASMPAPDPTPENNQSTVTVDLGPQADLSITKRAAPDPVTAGATLTYTFVVTNSGPSVTQGVVVTDTLPTSVTVSSAAGCATPAGLVVCTVGNLALNATHTLTVVVEVDSTASGVLSNTVVVAGNDPDPNPANNVDEIGTLVGSAADLTVTKRAAPEPAIAGTALTYTLVVTNYGPSTAHNVVVTDTLPTTVTVNAASAGCATPAGLVVCTVGDLALNATRTLTFVATVDPAVVNVITNTVVIKGVDPDPKPANDTDQITTTVNILADKAVTKSAYPSPVAAGAPITYTIVITNYGPSDAHLVGVADTLPTSITVRSAGSPCYAISGFVICPVGGLALNATRTFTFVAEVDPAATGVLTNNVAITGGDPDPNPLNDTDQIVTPITTSADLAVTKSAVPNPVTAGALLTYTLVVTNYGPSDALGVAITDTLPVFTRVSALLPTCTNPAGAVVCTVGNLAPNATHTVTIVVEVDSTASGVLSNTVVVAGNDPDPNPANNVAEIGTLVGSAADLAVIKRAAPDPVIAGTALTYTLVVTNYGPSTAHDVVVTDTLPGSVTVSSAAGCATPAGLVVCTVGDLALNATRTFTFVATVDPAVLNVITNTVVIKGVDPDPNPANNTDQITSTVNTLADKAVTKSAHPSPVVAGAPITYTIVITNYGPSDAHLVGVADTLPTSITVRSAGSPCYAISGFVICPVGGLALNATRTFTFVAEVDLAATGVLTNNVTITGGDPDPNPNNDTDQIVTPIEAVSDLGIIKSAAPNPVVAGSVLTYMLTAFNHGPSTSPNVYIEDNLPPGTTFLTVAPATCTGAGSIVYCAANEPFAPSATFPVTITVLVNPGLSGIITNTAAVSGPNPDPDPGNNRSDAPVEVHPQPVYDLALGKRSPACLDRAGIVTYTVTITNQGELASGAYSIVDTLPPGVQVVAISDGGFEEAGKVFWDVDAAHELPPGEYQDFNLVVRATDVAAAPFINNAEIYADSGNDQDSTPGEAPSTSGWVEDDQASATAHTCAMAILKQTAATTITAGSDLTFTISLHNKGSMPLSQIKVVDVMPIGMVLSPQDANGWTRLEGRNAAAQTYPGPLLAGQTESLSIRVVVTGTTGTLHNTAMIDGVVDNDGMPIPELPPPDRESTAPIIVAPPTAIVPEPEPEWSDRIYMPAVQR